MLGAPTESERDSASLQLLDYGFSLYHRRTPVRQGRPVTRVAIADRDVSVGLAPIDDLRVTVRKGQRVETDLRSPAEVDGPIAEGQRLGEVDRPRRGRRGREDGAGGDRVGIGREPRGAL